MKKPQGYRLALLFIVMAWLPVTVFAGERSLDTSNLPSIGLPSQPEDSVGKVKDEQEKARLKKEKEVMAAELKAAKEEAARLRKEKAAYRSSPVPASALSEVEELEKTSDPVYDKAVVAYKAQQYKKAYNDFSQYFEKNPSSPLAPNAGYLSGECLFQQQEYERAISRYQEVITSYPKSDKAADALLKQGLAFERLAQPETAKVVYGQLVAGYPRSESAETAQKRLNVLKVTVQFPVPTPVESAKTGSSLRPAMEQPASALASSSKSQTSGAPGSGANFTDPTTGMEFVYVKGGCYQMGDTFGDDFPGEVPHVSDEKPHEVCVSDSWLGKREVTQGEWKKVMGNNPSNFRKGTRYPVERVSWDDAHEFIKKLNKQSGKDYRLPTEAEWEYAAREGGKKVRFGTGKDTIGPDEANFDARAKYKEPYSRIGEYRLSTVAVGSFAPNGLGLYDMSGNVWEWCSDWYDKYYYASSPRNNPQGASSGSYRVMRGGSWGADPRRVRAAYRTYNPPDVRYDSLGFRLVLPPDQ